MSTKDRLSKALSLVLPAGAVGTSLLLAQSAQAGVSSSPPAPDAATLPAGVADRLKTIRAAITEFTAPGPDGANLVLAWWGNGGWGAWHPGWGNWHPGWGNGGWHNWGNGGWHNWGNGGWHNWGNGGWPNWSNGWNNFWHNAAAPGGAPPTSAPAPAPAPAGTPPAAGTKAN